MPRDLMNLISSIERINDILAQDPFIEDDAEPKDLEVEGKITFSHATFGYKSYQPVLRLSSCREAHRSRQNKRPEKFPHQG